MIGIKSTVQRNKMQIFVLNNQCIRMYRFFYIFKKDRRDYTIQSTKETG